MDLLDPKREGEINMPNADLEPQSFEVTIEKDGSLSARFSDDMTAAERQPIIDMLENLWVYETDNSGVWPQPMSNRGRKAT